MQQQPPEMSWIVELYGENFLAVYDVVLDIKAELQFNVQAVELPLLQTMIRFTQLMPADGINLRDRYCELRWKAAQLLRQRSVLARVEL